MEKLAKIIDSYTLSELNSRYDANVIGSLELNSENVYRVYNLLKMIGIDDVNELLLNRVDLFLMDYENVIKKLEQNNISEIVEKINIDPGYIEEVFFN